MSSVDFIFNILSMTKFYLFFIFGCAWVEPLCLLMQTYSEPYDCQEILIIVYTEEEL